VSVCVLAWLIFSVCSLLVRIVYTEELGVNSTIFDCLSMQRDREMLALVGLYLMLLLNICVCVSVFANYNNNKKILLLYISLLTCLLN